MRKRSADLDEALRVMAPRLPGRDRAAVVDRALGSRQMHHAPAPVAAHAALVAYARHGFTDYDALLREGYGRDEARFFVADRLRAVLSGWGCRNLAGLGTEQPLTPVYPSL